MNRLLVAKRNGAAAHTLALHPPRKPGKRRQRDVRVDGDIPDCFSSIIVASRNNRSKEFARPGIIFAENANRSPHNSRRHRPDHAIHYTRSESVGIRSGV
jgi:hypothetical protein